MSDKSDFERFWKSKPHLKAYEPMAAAWQAWQAARALEGGEADGPVMEYHNSPSGMHVVWETLPYGEHFLYTHPPAKVPEALWEALADCVSCFNCPEWSDKCEEVERKATKLLNSTTPTPATTPETEWVKPSEDLPSEDGRNPVWYWDNYQGVMLIPEHEAHRRLLRSEAHNPHWMPTGLKRPAPPQEQ